MLIIIRQAGAAPARRGRHGAVGLARDADEAVDAEGDGGQDNEQDNDDDGDDVVSLHFGRLFIYMGSFRVSNSSCFVCCWCWVGLG